ncbi:diaminobutyrate acetyltransferase [Epibacterium sp. SM1979]|uniref:L-2,4-diaminobutyric acid acetyltransferase n=1 Tax=Tritonibacter litoralis TaxID=2662264 RepID=A0A843YK78_9RHOB|nr:diaminobutyrate acetyltransferase [Tritonibacter litoralis]MQQ09824.1 diaminobutyrate acetyltransferase [Tritonibacter litoralis]
MQHPAHPMRVDVPSLRKPSAKDGAEIWKLVGSCRPLDENSMYCNMLQCDHFADTCVLAEISSEIVGWVSAYVMPNEPDTLFVWQVAVSEIARGQGLSGLMLQSILNRPQCKEVTRLQTTITADNAASWALFRKFSRLQNQKLESVPYYTQAQHFQEQHKTEYLVTIPLAKRAQLAA